MRSASVCADCVHASTSSGGGFDSAKLRERLEELERRASIPNLWDDREQAEKVLREKATLEREVGLYDELARALEDAEVLLELAVEEDDEQTRAEVAQ